MSSIEKENIEKLLGRNEPSSEFLSKDLLVSRLNPLTEEAKAV